MMSQAKDGADEGLKQGMLGGSKSGGAVLSLLLAAATLIVVLALQKLSESPTEPPSPGAEGGEISPASADGFPIPRLDGMEAVEILEVGALRAVVYRYASPPLVFTQGKFILYDQELGLLYEIDTLEGSRDPWTRLYDFSQPRRGRQAVPLYAQDLNGDQVPEVILGQYSGGAYCCTTATIVSVGVPGVRNLGRIEGISGLPFEGLKARDLNGDGTWELIVQLPVPSSCVSPSKAPLLPAVYSYRNGQFTRASKDFADYFERILRQHLREWRLRRNQSVQILIHTAILHSVLGRGGRGPDFLRGKPYGPIGGACKGWRQPPGLRKRCDALIGSGWPGVAGLRERRRD